ncbi:hypothetical protein K505DRAFT_284607 [Melanomma pulvis-pyrius CBS 109.77]|uniref:Ubiquitin 3 binding protein But2 C-terminal domain-containing protein n=1 Tax=Melanomma pulvis-pyrius CBS 109.77 TaxID=1314802 RepID=A0A6A6X043_9PLEO|nr:hypothetical protein K505DRAFT_284607 [Melanomma pulvis-pyrius CBS 109.77]
MKSLILASFLAAVLPTAFSLPEVTIKELPAGCASYPGYDEETKVAGPWTLQVTNSENTTMEGFGDISTYSLGFDPRYGPYLRWGAITIPARNDVAKTALKCASSSLQAYVYTSADGAGAPHDIQWTPLVLTPYSYDAALMYKINGGIPVKTYEHYIGEEKQDGVFLGGYNTTTWGFEYQKANQGSGFQDYYYMRLLGTDFGELGANETKGFIKIGA